MTIPAAARPILLLAAIAALAINLRAPIVAVGPLADTIRTELNLSGSAIGLVAAMPVLVFALCSAFAAPLARRAGLENILLITTLLLILGVGLRSAIPSLTTLLAGTAIMSVGIAMANVLLPALIKRSLPDRSSLAIGLMSAVMTISSALSTAMAVPVAQWHGWRWSLGVWLLTALLALAIWWPLRRPWPASSPQGTPSPETAAASAVPGALNVWRSPAAWVISLTMGLQSLAYYVVASFMPAVLVEKGLSAVAAGHYISLFQGSSLIGALLTSALFGRLQHYRQPLSAASSAMLVLGALGAWQGSLQTMWLWIVLLGNGTAAIFSLCMLLFAERTDDPHQAVALSGMAQAVGYTIAMLGPLGSGILYDLFGSWTDSLAFLVVLMAIECILAWSAASPLTLAQAQARRNHHTSADIPAGS